MKMEARSLLALALVAVTVGCGGEPETEADMGAPGTAATAQPSSSPSPEVRARLDSGTVAYRAGRLEDARRHYRAAVEADPHSASAWYGVHMAEKALGNGEMADSALHRARTLSPGAVPDSHTGGDGSTYEHAPMPSGSDRADGGDRSSS